MGIVNVTPDSFFKNSRVESDKAILTLTEKHLNDGADMIDLGGYSSRPGADHISKEEELKRVSTATELILSHFPEAIISVDTFRAKIAEECINLGAAIINDISAGEMDKDMFNTIAKHNIPYIIMHMQGTPETMQNNPKYGNIMMDLNKYFSEKINTLNKLGVNDIIIDPGFGFGKTIEDNFTLLKQLALLEIHNTPVLVGLSRKSMIYKTLNSNAENALNGTTALNMAALINGAKIVRVHDVKEAKECVDLFQQLK